MQHTVVQRGHAIEARVYAEDTGRGFVPEAGPLLLYREPVMPGIRVDAGVAEGSVVTVHYDPMIAKVIATAETRDLAIARLISALRAYPILGIRTNIPFLLRILDHPRFRAGDIDTGFLDGEGASLGDAPETEVPPFVSAALESARLAAVDGRKPPVDKERSISPGGDTASPTTTWDPWARLREWRP